MTESDDHLQLKEKVVDWLQTEHGFTPDEIEKEYHIRSEDSYYFIDVVGVNEEKKVAVECGSLSGQGEYREKRLDAIKAWCDEFKRFSYIYANADDLRQEEISRKTHVDIPEDVAVILTKYQLRAQTAQLLVTRRPCFNWVDLADDIGVSEDTVHNYRRAFKEMTEAERLRVIAVLSQDRFAEVVDSDR